MNAENGNNLQSLNGEREYWENRGPLVKGTRSQFVKPNSTQRLESFLSIRLSGKELTQLRDVANKCNRAPSALAREILIAALNYLNRPSQTDDQTMINIEDLCNDFISNLPQSYIEKIKGLMESSSVGDVQKPNFVIFNASQQKELAELTMRMLAFWAEKINPAVKVITPCDKEYDKVKDVFDLKERNQETVKT